MNAANQWSCLQDDSEGGSDFRRQTRYESLSRDFLGALGSFHPGPRRLLLPARGGFSQAEAQREPQHHPSGPAHSGVSELGAEPQPAGRHRDGRAQC